MIFMENFRNKSNSLILMLKVQSRSFSGKETEISRLIISLTNISYFFYLFLFLYCFFAMSFPFKQGVTKRCRLSWLTNNAVVYEPKAGGGGELRGFRQ